MNHTATFIDARTGAVVPPTKQLSSAQQRLNQYKTPGQTGSRRYPFRIASFGIGLILAKHVGQSICVLDERTSEVHRIDPDGQHCFLYVNPRCHGQ